MTLGAALVLSVLPAQQTALDPLVGRDLWEHRLSVEEDERLSKIVGEIPKGFWWPPAPWHIWKTGHADSGRYVVLFGESAAMVPGGSSACVVLLGADLKRINRWCFQAGWRLRLNGASFEYSPELRCGVITLETARDINGRDIVKEYFALKGDQLALLRVESSTGQAVQAEYVFPNFEIGLTPRADTEDQWLAMLESGDLTESLPALIFLGGRHVDTLFDRESRYAAQFEYLLSSPRIRRRIAELAGSENEWLRQAAALANRPPRERRLH